MRDGQPRLRLRANRNDGFSREQQPYRRRTPSKPLPSAGSCRVLAPIVKDLPLEFGHDVRIAQNSVPRSSAAGLSIATSRDPAGYACHIQPQGS